MRAFKSIVDDDVHPVEIDVRRFSIDGEREEKSVMALSQSRSSDHSLRSSMDFPEDSSILSLFLIEDRRYDARLFFFSRTMNVYSSDSDL